VFLAILGAGGDKDPVGATKRVLGTITDMVSGKGYKEPLRFTSALSNGRDSTPFVIPPTTMPIRCTIRNPAAMSLSSRSRSMAIARTGSRFLRPRDRGPRRPAGLARAIPRRAADGGGVNDTLPSHRGQIRSQAAVLAACEHEC
jgi:hypothetical protein